MKNIWNILQIERTSDAKEIREAYVRRLKETKPEVDPKGFQELREAYERALNRTTAREEKSLPQTSFSIPKAPPVRIEAPPAVPQTSFSIPKAPPVKIEAPPAVSETESQVCKMIEELSRCQDAPMMLNRLRKWKEEGAFNHFGVSLHFQEELCNFISHEHKKLKNLFLLAYTFFDWNQILQKPSHPLAQKLENIIEEAHLGNSLMFLKETKDFPFLFAATLQDVPLARQILAQNPSLLDQTNQKGNTALHVACQILDIPFIKFLIAQNVNLDLKNQAGRTALTIGIERSHLKLVQLLCEAGASRNPENGAEALNLAALTQNLEMVQLLVETGCAVSSKKNTPLITAARLNYLDILEYLLSKGADAHQKDEALSIAAERGFTKIVTSLLTYGAHSNAILLAANGAIKYSHFDIVPILLDQIELTTPENILCFRGIKSQMYIYGFISSSDDISLHCNPPTGNLSAINNNPLAVETFPPLIQAVYRGGLRDVKKKLKAGSDLHQTTPHGLSALHVAIQLHHHAIFDYLIQCQANIDQTAQPSYFSPLFVAVKVQNKHAYRKLMELGARDLPTSLHHTALFAAVYNNDLPAVQELLARGSDPYQYAITLICTLVYTAARYRHLEMLKFLLAYGLDPDDVGGDFSERYFFNLWENPEVPSTALSVAVSYCDQEMVELLLEAGADPNRKSGGAPPLHRAMANGLFPPSETINYYEIIERAHAIIDLLLQHGADIDLKSDDGYTFLTKAVKSGPIETVIHLIESGATINIPDNQGKFPIDHAKERGEKIIVNYLQQERSLL